MEKNKKVIRIVRGAFANPFELQNFYPLQSKYDLQLITSQHPLSSQIDLPSIKLWSPTDLPNFPFKYPILNRLLTDIHYLHNLESQIRGCDIVHVAETYYHYTHQAILAKQKGYIKKIVSTVWEVIPHNNEGIKRRQEFKQLAFNHIDKFICVTDLARQGLLREGVNPDKITVIPVGVDLARFSPSSEKPEMSLLCVSRLVPEKGIETLIKAFKILKSQHKNLSLTIIGSGPLTARAIAAGIKVQSTPYSQIHMEYQRATLLIHPAQTTKTWQEQFGMALVEGMACGLPIITTDTGAIKEVVGDAGLFFTQADPKSLAAIVDNCLKGVALCKTLSAIARKRSQTLFDSQKTAARIDKLYQTL